MAVRKFDKIKEYFLIEDKDPVRICPVSVIQPIIRIPKNDYRLVFNYLLQICVLFLPSFFAL